MSDDDQKPKTVTSYSQQYEDRCEDAYGFTPNPFKVVLTEYDPVPSKETAEQYSEAIASVRARHAAKRKAEEEEADRLIAILAKAFEMFDKESPEAQRTLQHAFYAGFGGGLAYRSAIAQNDPQDTIRGLEHIYPTANEPPDTIT